LVGWPFLILGLYLLAALIGGSIPASGAQAPAQSGNIVYIYDNGIHTSFILPRIDSLGDVAARTTHDADFAGDSAEYPWIMIGWGDRDFFLNTPRWTDIRPQTALTALWGSGASLIHIDRITQLPPERSLRRIILTEQQYAALLSFITPQYDRDREGKIQPISGYSKDDQFYRSIGREYSAFYTCNNWVGEALMRAGVKTGIWTPMPFGVMWWD
jgi:uncharacterized protein (TIGR02117 family)